jgi:hypothetical protein
MNDENAWKLEGNDLTALANLLNVEIDSIKVTKTYADKPAPKCLNCNRQIGLLDMSNTALSSAHHGDFLKNFFQDRLKIDPDTTIQHRVNCYQCGVEHPILFGWAGTNFGWTYN